MIFKTINPTTEEPIKSYRSHSQAQTDKMIKRAQETFEIWKALPSSERASLFHKTHDLLLEKKNDYALLAAIEMGKPISQGVTEVEKCAWTCDFFARQAPLLLKDEEIKTDATRSFVTFEPLGIILAIMPWNFPFWQVFRFGVAALMAGNVCLVKHAPNTFGCALAIEELFIRAGFPRGVLQNLLIEADQVPKIIRHPAIAAVSLTGSVRAGRSVAQIAGGALKKCVLELGGSDPLIVLSDANINLAIEIGVASRINNAGQSCVAAKRFIVNQKLFEPFVEALLDRVKKLKWGNPLEAVDLGPIARSDLRANLHRQVSQSIKKGAKLVIGGKIPEGRGYFYPPTILTHVKKGMPAYDEELFGPVFSLIKAKEESQAIRLANDTSYGLGATLITQDIQRGEKIASRQIEAGCCFMNRIVKSDPRLPFGGIKSSGYGRELSIFGIREFVNVKTVWVDKA